MRVLVLDDKPDAALLRVLRTMGAVPLVARTEEEAIVIINAGIDAAIVDMQLEPNWRDGGITVIRYLRQHLGDSVPVILFAGHLDAGAWAQCEQQLKARYVVKPGPTIRSLVDYLRENLAAATRRRSGVRASPTASKDLIASACAARQEECNLSAMETVVLEESRCPLDFRRAPLKMNISPETVKTHTRKLIAKTGDESLVGAGARVVRDALVTNSRRQEVGARAIPRAGDVPHEESVQMPLGPQGFDHHTVDRTSTRIDLAREEAYAKAIAAASGNLTKAGQLLGVSRQAVQNFIARQRR